MCFFPTLIVPGKDLPGQNLLDGCARVGEMDLFPDLHFESALPDLLRGRAARPG